MLATPNTQHLATPQDPLTQAQTFEERMLQGDYLKTLVTYDVKWGLQKSVRDLLQNFFDASGTLDHTLIDVQTRNDAIGPIHEIRVSDDPEYDYRKLLHYGGTGKHGKPTAGGFGEGTKVLALVLLRDFGCSRVEFGSADWKLHFYLAPVPEGSYDEPVDGVWAKLERVPPRAGNYVEITTRSSELAHELEPARSYFFHKSNDDFHNPTVLVSAAGGGEYGFKFLGAGAKGHFYDAGQRRHYESDTDWASFEGGHLWTRGLKVFGEDRERGRVSRSDVDAKVITSMAKAMRSEQLRHVLRATEAIWPNKTGYSWDGGVRVLQRCAEELAARKEQVAFDSKYLAVAGFVPNYIESAMEAAGYVLCRGFLKPLGMKDIVQRFKEMQSHLRIEPSSRQNARCELLSQAAQIIVRSSAGKDSTHPLVEKPIWLYSRENEKSILNGQYDEEYVWMCAEELEASFGKALSLYLHEICHRYGNDQSAEFSYAVTDAMEQVMNAWGPELERLKTRWNDGMARPKGPAQP